MKHNHSGNGWARSYACPHCGKGNLCDVCHAHDEPKGECLSCDLCKACEAKVSKGIHPARPGAEGAGRG